jgi:predicted DsbA family dithiol-disulfide isomerase
MANEGLPFGERTRVYNSRLAQELAKWAETQTNDKGLMRGIYEAYFVDQRNISDVDVLLDVVGKCGLPMDEAREVLESRSFRDAVDRDWAESRAVGVTSVPTFVTGRVGVMGAQPYAVLEQLVTQAGARKRSAASRE